jgi:hypothetical protein
MKCQHCGSKDVINIQGQNFCLNCGVEVIGQVVPVIKKASPAVEKNSVASNGSYKPAAKPQVSQPSAFSRSSKKPLSPAASVHPLKFAFKVGSTLAVLVGSVVGGAVWFELDNDWFLYLAVSGLILLIIMITLSQAALLYGFAKKYDGFPTSHRLWWGAARNGFMDIINVNLICLIILLALAGLDFAVWQLAISQAWHVYLEAGLIGVINAAFIWVLLGVYVAKRLAVPAVAIGGLSAMQALKIGWRFYLKAGGHLVAAALEIVVARMFAIALIGLIVYFSFNFNWGSDSATIAISAALLTALVSFMAVMTFLEVEMRIWQRQYRQWAGMLPAALRLRLTTGRVKAVQ